MRSIFTVTKRFFIFIVLNILIVTTAMIVASAIFAYLGLSIEEHNITFYAIFYGIIGMCGSFISLYTSIFFVKKSLNIGIIDPSARSKMSQQEQKIYQMVFALSKKAGLPKTPQIGVYQSPEVNAFATGPSKRNSLVAVSSGLLSQMDDDELEGVLAHEIAHIANGDMVTMALVVGMVNTMVLLLARLCAQVITSRMNRRSFFMEYMIFIAFQMVFNILGTILVVNVFSRAREYKADKEGARLSGKNKMIQALKSLQSTFQYAHPASSRYNAFKISSHKTKRNFVMNLFSTHPPLEMRIRRLERMRTF